MITLAEVEQRTTRVPQGRGDANLRYNVYANEPDITGMRYVVFSLETFEAWLQEFERLRSIERALVTSGDANGR